jgi:galactokinase
MDRDALQSAFDQAFGPGIPPRFVISPGRVNLIGEHTDYNAGFVCPMAIEPHVLFAFRVRDDDRVRVGSTFYSGELVEFRLSQPIEPHPENEHWSNYIRGIAAELLHKGVPLAGVDVMLANTLPTGSGLSSSAAVEVGMGKVLLAAAGQEVGAPDLAILAQQAEHNFPKVMCGIMDQMIVATGKRDHAMLLDCRSLERKYLPIDSQDLRVVIVNSMQRHANAGDADSVVMPDGSVEKGTPYNMRRIACETGVLAIRKNQPHIKSLRDATLPMLDGAKAKLTDLIYRRCRHVITEIERCEQFAKFMGESRYDEAGELMVASHNSLRDDYEVSAKPLDFLAAEAMKTKGVYGSRMTGAGFGGCTVSLVQPRAVDVFTKNITAAYEKEYKKTPQVIVTTATDGARVLAADERR